MCFVLKRDAKEPLKIALDAANRIPTAVVVIVKVAGVAFMYQLCHWGDSSALFIRLTHKTKIPTHFIRMTGHYHTRYTVEYTMK